MGLPPGAHATALDRWLLAYRREALALALALALAVLGCLAYIEAGGSFPFDTRAIGWVENPQPPALLGIPAEVFAALADPVVACVSVAAACLAVDLLIGRRHAALVLVAVGAVGLSAAIKLLVGPTPLQVLKGGPLASSNFPSGHVVYATTLFGVLAWFALARARRFAFAVMVALVAGMGPLRIVDGAHWPSDVLAGYALGLAWTIAVLVLGLPWATRAHVRGVPASQSAAP
jgi:undecaprenyl-diphosphatase